jgi:hypothetical protein
MKAPISAVIGNLVWNRSGQVWAVYAVEPVGSLHASHSQRIKVFNRLRSAFMKLPTEAHLLSIGETVDPFDVLTATLPANGVLSSLGRDLQQRYEGYLTAQRSVRRSHYVALLLDRVGSNDLAGQLNTAMATVTETLGATVTPSPKEVKRCERRAAEMAAKFGSVRLDPVTPGRVRWLSARLLSRGVDDLVFDESWEPRSGAATTSLTGPFQEVRFLEGGDRDDAERGRLGRYVRADTSQGSGFHTCLVLSDMPTNWRFPGDGELLAELESAAEESERGEVIEADISIRIKRIENAKARKKTKSKQTTMVHQRDEYSGSATGAPDSLDSAADSLRDLRRALEANKAEPELECTVIVHLADSSLPRLERHAESLRSQFEPANYGLVRPIGDQMKLLSMMWPGSKAVPPVRDYRQHLLARDLASTLPFNGSDVGDDRGGLFGINLDSGVSQQVHFDPSRGPRNNMPGNWAACGEPGAGKSASGKRIIELVIADGGQVATIDRTEHREYVVYAHALAKMGVPTQVVEIGASTGPTIDPMIVFGPTERVTVTIGFVSQLCMVETGSLEAMALADAVDAVSGRNGRLVDVRDELQRHADNGVNEASMLARKLDRFARIGELGHSVFGDGEPVAMDAGFVVFSLAGLDLPSRQTLENEHLSKRMLDSQVAAQALLYLVAAYMRRATFANRARFAMAVIDEFWGLKSSPYGRALIDEWVRDSRKHNAAVGMLSQHPDDFDESVRSFLGSRMVFRQRTPKAAAAALAFLDVTDDEMIERLVSSDIDEGGFASGTCLIRDLDNRVGLVQVHQSFNPYLREASDTNPSDTNPSNRAAPTRREQPSVGEPAGV